MLHKVMTEGFRRIQDSEEFRNAWKLQFGMARVVTGACRGTSHELLYDELNWMTLAECRELAECKNSYL